MAFIKCSGGGEIWKTGTLTPIKGTVTVNMNYIPTTVIMTRGVRTNNSIRISCVLKAINSSGEYQWFRIANGNSEPDTTSSYQIQKYTEGSNSFNFKWDSNSTLPSVNWMAL